jgi:predicted DNA-binding protein with PD1-like motif
MRVEVLRLVPGDDLRASLEAAFAGWRQAHGVQAACVVSAVGSLSRAVLRYADKPAGSELLEPLELIFLSGTLSPDGAHLHASVANGHGEVRGGHVMPGCIVRTTAEVVVGLLPGWEFRREVDEKTGFKELVVKPAP